MIIYFHSLGLFLGLFLRLKSLRTLILYSSHSTNFFFMSWTTYMGAGLSCSPYSSFLSSTSVDFFLLLDIPSYGFYPSSLLCVSGIRNLLFLKSSLRCIRSISTTFYLIEGSYISISSRLLPCLHATQGHADENLICCVTFLTGIGITEIALLNL